MGQTGPQDSAILFDGGRVAERRDSESRQVLADMMKPHSIIWWVLPGFVAIDAALLIPLETIQWGYLEDLPLLVVSIGALAAQFAVLSVWAAMADIRGGTRLGCVALVLIGVLVASLAIEDGGPEVFFTTACVAFAGALALRMSGWRFQRVRRSERHPAGRMSWQFSLADLTVLTLGAGLLLGLLRWGGARWLELDSSIVMWLAIGSFAIGLTANIAVGLMSRRVWRAIGVALVGIPLGVFVVQMCVNQNANLVAFVSLIAGACLVPIILLVRVVGIRLVHIAK